MIINTADFKNSSAGQIVRTVRGYDAFVPSPLPRSLSFSHLDSIRLIADAERTLGKLSGIGYLVPNPDFLVIPYTRLEAVASSRIEGTQTSLSELFYFEAAEQTPKPTVDLVEVTNYVAALNYGLRLLDELPLSLRLIRHVHHRLMTGVRGGTPDKTPGEFRTSQNWIGGVNLHDATFVPPPPERLPELLRDWETFLHEQETPLPLLVQCAMAHYQFEAIHPFLDGNGRVGRLVVTLLLCARGALPYPLLYLSDFFERHRREYYDRLLAVSQLGDWEGWIRFFLYGVVQQGEHAIRSAKMIVDQREEYRRRLQSNRASASVLALLDLIFINPYLTVNQAAKRIKVSLPTARDAIHHLVSAEVLEEITGRQRNRIFVAREMLSLLTQNEPIYVPERRS